MKIGFPKNEHVIFEILTIPHTKPKRYVMSLETVNYTLSDTLRDLKERILK